MDMVRGEHLNNAKKILAFDPTKASKMILKVLKSAEANAVNNHNLKPEDLYVKDIFVNSGRMQKWGRPSARGRYSPQLRRTSHIVVGLSSLDEAADEKKSGAGILGRKK